MAHGCGAEEQEPVCAGEGAGAPASASSRVEQQQQQDVDSGAPGGQQLSPELGGHDVAASPCVLVKEQEPLPRPPPEWSSSSSRMWIAGPRAGNSLVPSSVATTWRRERLDLARGGEGGGAGLLRELAALTPAVGAASAGGRRESYKGFAAGSSSSSMSYLSRFCSMLDDESDEATLATAFVAATLASPCLSQVAVEAATGGGAGVDYAGPCQRSSPLPSLWSLVGLSLSLSVWPRLRPRPPLSFSPLAGRVVGFLPARSLSSGRGRWWAPRHIAR
nr:unnamed protein product [Digitaria exilis]